MPGMYNLNRGKNGLKATRLMMKTMNSTFGGKTNKEKESVM